MLRRLMRSPRLFPALFFLFVLLMASRNSKFTTDAAAPATEAKQGLTGSYCTTTGLWYSGTPPDPAEPVNRFVQVWIDRNDFRLPNPFTDPLVARADAQVAFGHGKGFVPQIGQQAAANAKYDLTGTWSADYVDGPLKVQITQTGTQVNAVLITGNQYIPAGKRDFYGTFDSNPFQGKQIWAYAGYRSPHWEDAEITVVDADHFTLVSKGDTVHFARDCNPDKNRLCGALSNASEIDRKMTDWGAKERHTPTGKEWNEILSARGPELASGLEEALKQACNNPSARELLPKLMSTLTSIDANAAKGRPQVLKEGKDIAGIGYEVDNLRCQTCGEACGPSEETPSPSLKSDCGPQPDDKENPAVKQVIDGIKEAVKKVREETDDLDKASPAPGSKAWGQLQGARTALGKLEQLEKFWENISKAKCLPPEIPGLVQWVLADQQAHRDATDDCNNLCHSTAKWLNDVDPAQFPLGTFFVVCSNSCGGLPHVPH